MKNKFYKFHQGNGHNTNECRARKYHEKNKNQQNSKTERGCALLKPRITAKRIEILVEIQNETITSLLDSSSLNNFIQQELIRENKVQITVASEKKIIFTDRSLPTSKRKARIELELKGKVNENFYILNKCSLSVILGMTFLSNNNFYLSIKENIFGINGKYFPISENKLNWDEHDKKLLEKIENWDSLKESPKEILTELVAQYKQKSPALGLIKEMEHEIQILNKTPFTNQAHSIFILKLEANRKETQILISLGVIRSSSSNAISGAFSIYKQNSQVRIVVDYWLLNQRTVPLRFPMLPIHKFLKQIQNSTVFSVIYLNLCYH